MISMLRSRLKAVDFQRFTTGQEFLIGERSYITARGRGVDRNAELRFVSLQGVSAGIAYTVDDLVSEHGNSDGVVESVWMSSL